MSQLDLQTVRDLMRFECALCGKALEIDSLMPHADRHAKQGECLHYTEYACASCLDTTLESYPLTLADGTEVVWPFRLQTQKLEAVRRHVSRAG